VASGVLEKSGSVEKFVHEGVAEEGVVVGEHRVESNRNRPGGAAQSSALEQLIVVHLKSGIAETVGIGLQPLQCQLPSQVGEKRGFLGCQFSLQNSDEVGGKNGRLHGCLSGW
jgi:hypothetical protein